MAKAIKTEKDAKETPAFGLYAHHTQIYSPRSAAVSQQLRFLFYFK